ncbi:MAG: hypothetical protein ACJ746_30185 [Bryobacteraceae bacterium]
MEHCGRAFVFEDVGDLHARIDDPNLDVEPDDVLVNCFFRAGSVLDNIASGRDEAQRGYSASEVLVEAG